MPAICFNALLLHSKDIIAEFAKLALAENALSSFNLQQMVNIINQEYGFDDRKFSITYTVNDCVGIYKDTAELYWQLIGSDFSIFAKENYIILETKLQLQHGNQEEIQGNRL